MLNSKNAIGTMWSLQLWQTPMRRSVIKCGVFGLVLLLDSLSVDAALADRRVALVLGNSNYQHVPALSNPANDARALAAKFREVGFDVVIT
jgi:hypothetical protein